ncbi:unnamed protein product [Didymodactylos carnosus]|uniref:Uncharacterized protein n=1 Tax=Didymodactylos carnosus TaxID=1234261 RepID=A0A814N2H0_9BILA|nr:unnamed protein product [Didymodactylos carnosus]CAF3850239.1 unnamed protein product [Didymodactylos carnosus]
MNNALPTTVPDNDKYETYSVHITNLSDDVTAEYLSENLRYSIGDILMNPSKNECWIRRSERKLVADQLVANLNSKRIRGKSIRSRELGHSNKNQCRISDTDPSTATIVNQKSLKYAKRLVERCHNKAYPDGHHFENSITHLPKNATANFKKALVSLEEAIRLRADYNQNICLLRVDEQEQRALLFGEPGVVVQSQQSFEKLKESFQLMRHKVNFTQLQIKYLLTICYQQLQELESRYKDDGVDILSKLPVNEIVSSGDIFEKLLRPRLLDYASVNSEAFDLSDCNLANEKEFYSKLVLIAQPYGCHLEMKTAVQKVSVNVPTTLATEYADQPTEANAVDKSEEDGCTKINRSEIKVVLGDLTTEKADIIVVCSNSDVLKSTILKAAGLQVADEYNTGNNARQKLSQQPCDIATSPGYLKCKKILFLPWKPVPSLASAADQSLTRHSVSHFVKTAIDFAFASNYKSIGKDIRVGLVRLALGPEDFRYGSIGQFISRVA